MDVYLYYIAYVYVPHDYKSLQFKIGNWEPLDDAQGYDSNVSCKTTQVRAGIYGLTGSASVTEHNSNFLCVWACTIFTVASCLHHYLTSNCTSLLTVKCLQSNFKLEDIFKFSENNFFPPLNISA